MTTLYHFTTIDKNGRNHIGEPVTIKQEGLRKSYAHPVCMTPDPEGAASYAAGSRGNGTAVLYAINSNKVPEIKPGQTVWYAEYVPLYAIEGEVVIQFSEFMTPRDIQWRIIRAGKRKGLI